MNLSKKAMVQNGMDIAAVFSYDDVLMESILEGSIGYAHTAFVHYLNANGHPLAAQALDDLWHAREEQWWREPDGFDCQYKTGAERNSGQ